MRKPISAKLCVVWSLLALLLFLDVAAQPRVNLKDETREAFDSYVKDFEARAELEIKPNKDFLWRENLSQDELERLRSGEILVEQVESNVSIPSGLLHDWVGVVFIPEVESEAVLALLTDFDQHAEIYPEVSEARLVSDEGAQYRSYLRLIKKQVLTVVLDTEHEGRVERPDAGRIYLISHSTRISEVRNPGAGNEEILPVGDDSGFLWRLNAYWAIDQKEDGVLLGCRSISLSRDIPWGLGWMIKPFIQNMPHSTLEETLQATRLALMGKPGGME